MIPPAGTNPRPRGSRRTSAPIRRLDARAARELAPIFKALADPTRLEILGMLDAAGTELCVCEIEAKFDLRQPTISHHLRLLREAQLVDSARRGTWVYYRSTEKVRATLDRCAALLRAGTGVSRSGRRGHDAPTAESKKVCCP